MYKLTLMVLFMTIEMDIRFLYRHPVTKNNGAFPFPIERRREMTRNFYYTHLGLRFSCKVLEISYIVV